MPAGTPPPPRTESPPEVTAGHGTLRGHVGWAGGWLSKDSLGATNPNREAAVYPAGETGKGGWGPAPAPLLLARPQQP